MRTMNASANRGVTHSLWKAVPLQENVSKVAKPQHLNQYLNQQKHLAVKAPQDLKLTLLFGASNCTQTAHLTDRTPIIKGQSSESATKIVIWMHELNAFTKGYNRLPCNEKAWKINLKNKIQNKIQNKISGAFYIRICKFASLRWVL